MVRGLELLQPNHAGALLIKGVEKPINYGVVKFEDDLLTYYTSQAMKEMFGKSKWLFDNEDFVKRGLIRTIDVSEIERVLF